MDINFLKQRFSIDDYMQSSGYKKSNKSTSNHSCYHSPFTNEKTPSFMVNLSKSTFSDYSSGERGDIIKLVELTQRCSFKEAVAYLESKAGELPVRMIQEKKELIIESVYNLTNPFLIDYITQVRQIPIDIVRKYCKEVKYSIGGKKYYAIGFQNDKGGWELRNANWKGGNSPKYYSTVYGNNDKTNVFEGFMDFLSALSHNKTLKLKYKTIILNSVVFADQIEQANEYNIFTDNDKAGDSVIEKLKQRGQINDMRNIYSPYKDYNEYLVNQINQYKNGQ